MGSCDIPSRGSRARNQKLNYTIAKAQVKAAPVTIGFK